MDMKAPNQRIELIALDDMEPETTFQRGTKTAQVKNIVKKYDDAQLGVITVSWRDGKYQIIDGAHRAKSLRDLGFTHAYCVVLEGLTLAQEANYFRKQNNDRRPTTVSDNFKAGITAQDERDLRIIRIAKEHGFRIGNGARDFYRLSAITALYTIVEDYDYYVLDITLWLISATWPGIKKASQSEFLLGVAEFASRYNAAEFPERMKDKFAVVWYEYNESMSYHGSMNTCTARKKFCRILVEQYNRGLGSRSKLRLVWED